MKCKKPLFEGLSAEKEGFEPPDLLQSTVFKTAAFDRSAISPIRCYHFLIAVANIRTFFRFAKNIFIKTNNNSEGTSNCFIIYMLDIFQPYLNLINFTNSSIIKWNLYIYITLIISIQATLLQILIKIPCLQ